MLAQDYFHIGGSNYGGITQVLVNPANAADNRLKTELLICGFDLHLNNSWFAIKSAALNYDGELLRPAGWKFPGTWRNFTPGVPDNIFKNFVITNGPSSHSVIIENRLMLPSVLYQIDDKQSVAFTWCRRQIGNLDGISDEVANLFEKELDLSVTRNNNVRNEKLSAIQMTWVEYGLTYARVLAGKGHHFLKAGATPKIVQGVESAYLVISDIDILLSTKDTNSRIDASFSTAKSVGMGRAFRVNPTFGGLSGKSTSLALDLGVVYEWRPGNDKLKQKQAPVWRTDFNKYRIKFSASVNDIGSIGFKKEPGYYDLNLSLRQYDVTRYTTITTVRELDSLLTLDFPSTSAPGSFEVFLPTAVNLQLDVSVIPLVYVNMGAHLADLHRSTYRVHNYSAAWIAPRFECFWFDVSIPFTWHALSATRGQDIAAGLNVRAGPLSLGTTDFRPFFKGDVSALNFFFTLRVALPHKPADRENEKKHAIAAPANPARR